jgi:hypothetical protein
MNVLVGILLAALPIVLVLALLRFAARLERREQEAHARQIAVTDAIHRQFGAIVAPTVEPRPHGAWRLTIPVPFERPEVVASVLDVAHQTARALDRADGDRRHAPVTRPRPMEIVLTPQEEHRACA